jgi:Domain of unknown function (DUF4266)
MKLVLALLLLSVFTGLSSCSSMGVKPWERDLLSQPGMTFGASLESGYDEHIYFSKEASSGGSGFTGGGCGCN